MIEAAEVKPWLTSTLLAALATTAAAGKVYDTLADDAAALPYVFFTFTAQADVYVVSRGKRRVWSPGRWTVLAVCEGESFAPIASIANIISVTLHGAAGTTSTVRIGPCVRVQPLEYSENSDGVRYNYRGAEFDIKAQAR